MFCVSELPTRDSTFFCAESRLVVSIPILLLWSVKINVRRKLGLGSLLCLSIFAIITNIIRASGHKLDNGQDDVVWVLFWLEMEGCIALIANSMTAFWSLFAASNSRNKNSPQNQAKSAGFRMKGQKRPPHVELPTLTTSKISGLRSMMLKDPFEDRETMDSNGSWNWSGIQDPESLDTTTASGHQAQSTRRVSCHLRPTIPLSHFFIFQHPKNTEKLTHLFFAQDLHVTNQHSQQVLV